MQDLKERHTRASGRPWLVKVVTDLGTRLWVYIQPHLLVRDLQGAIEIDHRAAFPACGDVTCQLISMLEYENGRDVANAVNGKYCLQDVLGRSGARVYAEFLDKASKAPALQLNNASPLQIGLSPAAPQLDVAGRSYTRGTVCETTPISPLGAAELTTPQAPIQQGLKRRPDDAQQESQQAGSKRLRHEASADGRQTAAALPAAHIAGHAAAAALLGGVQKVDSNSPEKHALPSSAGAQTDAANMEQPQAMVNAPQQGAQPDNSSSSEEEPEIERAPESAAYDSLGQMLQGKGSQQTTSQHGTQAQQQAVQAALNISPGIVQHKSSSVDSEDLSSSEEEAGPTTMPNGAQHAQQQSETAKSAVLEAQQPGSAQTGMAGHGRERAASSAGHDNAQLGATPENEVPAQQAVVPNGKVHLQGDDSSSSSSDEQSKSSDNAGPPPQPVLKPNNVAPAAQPLLFPHSTAQGPYPAASKAESSSKGETSSSSEVDSESSEEKVTAPPAITAEGALPAHQQASPAPVQTQAQKPAGVQRSSRSGEESESLGKEEPQQPSLAPSQAAATQQQTADHSLPGWMVHAVGDGKDDWTSSSEGESPPNRASGKAAGAQQSAPASPKQGGATQTIASQGEAIVSRSDSEQVGEENSHIKHPSQAAGLAPHQALHGKGKQAAAKYTQPQTDADRDAGAAAAGSQLEAQPAAKTRRQKAKAQGAAHAQPQDGTFPDSVASRKKPSSKRPEAGHANGAAIVQEANMRALDATDGSESKSHSSAGQPSAGPGSTDSEQEGTPGGERIISEAEYRKLQLWREAAENVNGNFFDILLEAQTEKKRRASLEQCPSTLPQSSAALVDDALKRTAEENRAAQEAKLKAGADDYFSQATKDLTNQQDIRKLLYKGLHLIVGYEQGRNLNSCAEMFRDAQRPGWWPLEKWNKAQMDRKLLDLQKIYKVAQKRWQVMRKAVKERETGKRGKGQP